MQKSKPVKSEKLRRSADGRPCTFNIAGVCNYNPETSVLCHLPSDIAGYKSTDLSSAIGCSDCHAAIDDRSKLSGEDYEFYCRRAMVRTQHYWLEEGFLKIA